MDDYESNTQVIRACKNSQRIFDTEAQWGRKDRQKWRKGDSPFLYFIDSTPPMSENIDVIALRWTETLPEGFELDYDRHIEKSIADPLEPILDGLNWNWSEISTGKQAEDAMEADW